jgi:WhiB family redox-sensing transcriptional regulator
VSHFIDHAPASRPRSAVRITAVDPETGTGLDPDLAAAMFEQLMESVLDGEVEPEEWQDRALCAQTDPESFFPEKGGSTREAKRICGSCEVRAECLEYALAQDERFGIWGGLSERERRRLRRGDADEQGAAAVDEEGGAR